MSKTKSKPNRVRRSLHNWTVEKTLELIEQVQQYECLWNVTIMAYKQRDHKEMLWRQIGEELGIDSHECKVKWNSTRIAYRTALKTQRSRPGQTVKKHHKSNYIYESLRFLDDILLYYEDPKIDFNNANERCSSPMEQAAEEEEEDTFNEDIKYSFNINHTDVENDANELHLISPDLATSPVASPEPTIISTPDLPHLPTKQAMHQKVKNSLQNAQHTVDKHDVFSQFLVTYMREWETIDRNQTTIFQEKVLSLVLETSQIMRNCQAAREKT